MDSIKKDQIIKNVYKLMSDLWCSPSDTNIQNIKKDSENVIKKLKDVNKEALWREYQLIRFLSNSQTNL